MSRVYLENVTKVFNKKTVAVKELTLEVNDGDFFVLVGPSGCGKSTVLRIIAGLEEVSSGNVYIGDRLVNDIPPKDRDVAMVFQNYALYPHMTAFDNMAFGLKLRKIPKDEIQRRVLEAARILNIEHLLSRKPKELSGGERQRVAVGRAIVRKPQVFLFDEPLSNIDAKLRVQMRAELSALHERLKTTTIYVTHDQTEAMTLGERIGVMKDGKLLQVDSAMKLYNEPKNKFVAGFIGSPPINFLDGYLKPEPKFCFVGEGIIIPLTHNHAEKLSRYLNKEITIGIRPEDVFLVPKPEEASFYFPAKLTVLEPMGSETIAYLTLDSGKRLVARLHGYFGGERGKYYNFSFILDKLHFFDKNTEERI
ncbi:MAG: sn-glycerol-3-phosphate ABC transporter ATP-binding protein UgpC [candidate division WOR-3 bacterium]|nr:sn-glycerol-3-phosphate ABC transporter ATP-binding protein UgpC [candidate division WOR-3 bacterium]MCX7756861.1 sn-glycerol-3-phosphate ABC transporter ATP-binding protein UgpC [candidate division WOR-3 bacterium]MDW7987633.1 sn-glycerol-3-phosphate ABC transporter ATP-binding protein UgpC [candidate division WOR-3 bacterium]